MLSVNMLGVCVGTFLSLLLCGAVFVEGARLVPSLEFAKSYETHVQITTYEETQSTTMFLEEYHDLEENVGRIDLVKGSARDKNFYFLQTKQAATIEEPPGLICKSESIKHLVDDYGFNEMNMYDNSRILGPSASLWKVNYSTHEPGDFRIRGIPCKKILNFDIVTNFTYLYYISSSDWVSVHGEKEEVPVRIEVISNDAKAAIMDFTFFEVNTSDSMSSSFLIPLHIGCPDLEVSSSIQMRTMDNANIIYYADEVTDLFAEENKAESITTLERTWLDEQNLLIKFDTLNKDYVSLSEILDFNTGVMYQTNNQGQCSMKPIKDAPVFEKKFKGSTGQLKSASEILMLNYEYTYLGQTMHRSIHCNVFEAIEKDYTYGDTIYKKMVFTYFVMTPEYKSAANQDSDQQYVVALDMTGYTDENKPADMQEERDFFDFRHLNQYPSGSDMNIENCFVEEGSKKYFAIYFPVTSKTLPVIEANRDQFLMDVKKLVMKVAGVSFLRLPFMKMFIDTKTVTILGEMLDRPPVLAGFTNEDSKGIMAGQKAPMKKTTPEECARECESGDTCRGFTYCENDQDCYLTPYDMKDGNVEPKDSCRDYNRAVMESNLKEYPLNSALLNLFNKVTVEKNFVVKLTDKEGVTHEIKADKMDRDLRIFDGDKTKKYEQIYETRHLVPNLHTIFEVEELVMNEADCFSKCLSDPLITCSSFSYCPSHHSCRISANTLRNLTEKAVNDLMQVNASCNVFRRKALELFSESTGLVPVSKGDKSYANSGKGADYCASVCLDEKEFACEGFESCEMQCVLHKKHILDLITSEGTPSCKHYYLNYSLSLEYISDVIVKDKHASVFHRVSLDECAKLCFDPKMQCRSINYCPWIADMQSICYVNTKTINDEGVTTDVSDVCQNYEKRAQDQDLLPPITKPPPTVTDSPTNSSSGSTDGSTDMTPTTTVETIVERRVVRQGVEKGAFTGAVIGMLIFGLVVGALGFLGYSYYRSRRAGDGISVRFTRQT